MKEHVLVTGGAGFIGSSIVDRLLSEGYQVSVVDNLSGGSLSNLEGALSSGRVTFHDVDVRSHGLTQVFRIARPAVVVHMAAQIDVRVSVADPMLDADVNIMGTLNVLERAREAGSRKVLVASSGGCVYGDARSLPVPETARGLPGSPYGISKRVLHDYLAFYRRVHGLQSAVLALSNVYGPRQDPHGEAGVVAIFLQAMLQGQKTTVFGEGSQTRDFVFVDDVVDAFARAVARGSGVFNIGTGVETSVMELWRHSAAVTGYKGAAPRFAPARAGELQRNALDSRRARRVLGWHPAVGLEQGLAATAAFIASRLATSRASVG